MITLNYRDSRPIYIQVKDAFRRMIITGALPANEKLPSVRELASELAINPNTIQRAYRELEAEGWICSVLGKGSFASPREGIDEKRREELYGKFDEIVTELGYTGVTAEELCERLKKGGSIS